MSEQTDYPQAAQVRSADEGLSGGFYGGPKGASVSQAPSSERPESKEKPTHYKVICISMYTKDLKRLDDMVDALKARGMTKANRSALIRYALSEVDLDRVPQGL